jgi:hypothetical protein
MAHATAMIGRLPALYREGELIAGVLGVPALQLEIAEEQMLEVQRSHWFNTTSELEEAARLAAVLDIAPESWQTLREYRGWVHALRNAMLRRGAVTPAAIQGFIRDYTDAFRAATASTIVPAVTTFASSPSGTEAAFVEFPERRRYDRIPDTGGIEPLSRFTIDQRGLDDTAAAFLLTGLPQAPEFVPLIANLTTGDALFYPDRVPVGARFWLRPESDGSVSGRLEGEDVTADLVSITGLLPGSPWDASQVQRPARALPLVRGRNELWFLPVAHFDRPGLDRALLSLADLLLQQGRWDESTFDHALFHQDAAVNLRMTWIEHQPATIDITLPGGALLSRVGDLDDALIERDRLAFALNLAVGRLKAAGVRATVALRSHSEQQGMMDRLVAVMPMVRREVGPTGADRVPDSGGVFTVTRFEDSTFR